MGLEKVNSALEKIVGVTQKVSDGAIGNVKIPTVVLGNSVSIGQTEVSSISGLLSSVKESASNLLQITKQVGCLILLATDREMKGNLLGGMAMSLVNVASALALQVAQTFATQIQVAINQVLGTISGTVTAIVNLVKSIDKLIDAISKIPDKFSALADLQLDKFLKKDECEAMFAQIAACYLAKLLNKLKVFDFANKLTNKINQVGSDMNRHLGDALHDTNVMNNYIQRESFLLEKSARQINAFSFV